MSGASSSIESAALSFSLERILLLLKLPSNNGVHFLFEAFVLETDLRQRIGLVVALSVMIVFRVHKFVSAIAVNPIVGVIKLLSCYDRLLKIQMSLRYVFLNDCATNSSKSTEGSFLLPVSNKSSLGNSVGFLNKTWEVVGLTVTDGLVENILCHLSN